MPSYHDLFVRTYEVRTTITVKETYEHKVKRLIREMWSDNEEEYVLELVKRESGYRYNAINPTSGAAGIPQALPPSKMKCGLTPKDIECQLDWMKDYLAKRYETVKIALQFHDKNNWY